MYIPVSHTNGQSTKIRSAWSCIAYTGYGPLDIVFQLCLVLGPSNTHLNYIIISSPCTNQMKKTQTFRAPPHYVSNLVPFCLFPRV